MLNKIIMPPGGQTTNESQICRWNKHVGDRIQRGDVLLEIETDKATLDVESYCEGILLQTCFDEGDSVETGAVVAYIGDEEDRPLLPGDRAETPDGAREQSGAHPAIDSDEERCPAKPASSDPTPARPIPAASRPSPILASPAAKKAARELHVDIDELGRKLGVAIVKVGHVREAASPASSAESEYELIKPTPMRTAIARRMTQSAAVPVFTAEVAVDMTACVDLRSRLNEGLAHRNLKISYNDILMKGIAAAIEKTPVINASWTDLGIRRYSRVHCGLAVGVESGLVVPVVRDVQDKSVAQIAIDNAANIDKARSGALSAEEQTGGTITLSNLGMFGIQRFTALLNPPEACILAAGAVKEQPVTQNGQVVSRPMMNITASFDHRVIDGAVGAAFLSGLRTLLECPACLLVL